MNCRIEILKRTRAVQFTMRCFLVVILSQTLLFTLSGQQNATTRDKIHTSDGRMYFGAAYYPEHWPKDRWETDLKLMKEAGFNVVRLAEFSWVLFEPSEGQYEFVWLDEFLKLLPKYGIKAILGTPTASMPAWVARKYPEVLVQKQDGSRMTWGSRQENSFTTPVFRRLSGNLTNAMAQHYKDHPDVIGWQIDNELWGPYDFSETTRKEFQNWLQKKYETLDKLNSAWGNHFWGHTIQDWAEITIPECEGPNPAKVNGNPGNQKITGVRR